MLRDFELLGIRSVCSWRGRIRRSCTRSGTRGGAASGYLRVDVFCAAVAQARNPRLVREMPCGIGANKGKKGSNEVKKDS